MPVLQQQSVNQKDHHTTAQSFLTEALHTNILRFLWLAAVLLIDPGKQLPDT